MTISCFIKGDSGSGGAFVELVDDAVLQVRCRRMNMWGVFNPSRIWVWRVSELDGFWVGRPRTWPPFFWGFELNDFCYQTVLVVSQRGERFYVREFERLTNTELLVECLDDLRIKRLEL